MRSGRLSGHRPSAEDWGHRWRRHRAGQHTGQLLRGRVRPLQHRGQQLQCRYTLRLGEDICDHCQAPPDGWSLLLSHHRQRPRRGNGSGRHQRRSLLLLLLLLLSCQSAELSPPVPPLLDDVGVVKQPGRECPPGLPLQQIPQGEGAVLPVVHVIHNPAAPAAAGNGSGHATGQGRRTGATHCGSGPGWGAP